MSVNREYCNPFEGNKDIWMKLEHCGRYLFACDFLREKGCGSVLDLACADGYGSKMLAAVVPEVLAADRNAAYMQKGGLDEAPLRTFCFDFDQSFPEALGKVDAVVSFETVEHLREPFAFLAKTTDCLTAGGWLLLSFPNAKYERLNPDNTNRDPFHLHILPLESVKEALEGLGYEICEILGQPFCNLICGMQHDLKEAGVLKQETVDGAFHHDAEFIKVLSRLVAYPMAEWADLSYSYLIVAKKK